MRDFVFQALVLPVALAISLVAVPPGSKAGDKATDQPRKVLVELYSSQGCDSCPPASDLLGKLAGLGYGPDQIVPINFHVDYFNTPWVDPFSDPSYSQRQQSYNQVKRRDDLYFTPMMMVDGRSPLLGSDRPKAVSAIKQARNEPAGVALHLTLEGKESRKSLGLTISPRIPEAVGRDVLVGVAVTEDPVSTKVPSGENAGKTLVEHHVVRRFDHKFVKLDASKPLTLNFPVELPPGADASKIRVTVFAQDRGNGKVHQADSIPWNPARTSEPTASRTQAKVKPRRRVSTWSAGFPGLDSLMGMMNQPSPPGESSDPPFHLNICPDCGSMSKLPLVGASRHSGQGTPAPSTVSC